ncbi:MAG TPA: HIT family protein [Orrella sp.]
MTDKAIAATATQCPLCQLPLPGELVRGDQWVIIDANEPMFPGFTRVVWIEHVREMTDLSTRQRQDLMDVVFEVEQIMRTSLNPHKVNLASLGNQAPHVHWHVIPRWSDDVAYPGPVWVSGQDTDAAQQRRAQTQRALADYHGALIQRFTA